MTTPPPPNQPGQPDNPFGNQGAPVPPNPVPPNQAPQQPIPPQNLPQQGGPGQQPDYSQQPTGDPVPGYGRPPVAGYAPVPGGAPYAPPAPKKPSALKKILTVVVPIVVVLIIGAIIAAVVRDKDSGKTVDASPLGSCIVVTDGTGLNVETEAIDCSDTSKLTYIVGAKLASSDACTAAEYDGSITETGTGASDDVLCLVANYQAGKCYEQSQIGLGLNLKEVLCTEESGMMSTVFKVTDRVESKQVPDCSGPKKKALAYDIKADPARAVGICAEIVGDYTWE
ncbi:LppU/SCO3897 family protein [Gordonia phthalatica]|uniref:Uncharacterized protein n=1 Tax=Gordonia phthalatica TaxID=1136941 RepID=A0A0N7FUR1_9ACTN|nr:hypothetical protein [Gordonia phthalatica]ALG85063.1 hypothetical protein ACH46_11945 [Gordonia phthalatica]